MSEYLDIVKVKLVQDGKPVAFVCNADVLNLYAIVALAEAAERQAAALERIAANLDRQEREYIRREADNMQQDMEEARRGLT